MVLVLFFSLLIIFLIVLIVCSTIKLEVKELELSNEIENTPLIKDLNLCIGIYLFNKIKIFKKCINKNQLQKINNSSKMQKIKTQFLKNKNKGQMSKRSKCNKTNKA